MLKYFDMRFILFADEVIVKDEDGNSVDLTLERKGIAEDDQGKDIVFEKK